MTQNHKPSQHGNPLMSHLHALGSVSVVKLHVVARLDPAHRPRLLGGHRGHEDARAGAEVRRPVAQHHARGLVDAGGLRVDGGGHLQHDDAETLRLAPEALDAAHVVKQQQQRRRDPPKQRPGACTRPERMHRILHPCFFFCLIIASSRGRSNGKGQPPSLSSHCLGFNKKNTKERSPEQ